MATVHFPAWYLGKYPDHQIITASYNAEISSDWGRMVRNIVASTEFSSIFRYTNLAADSQSANRWHTDQGGSYVAAGVGTAITGRGAHVAIIDDPHKDREEADSKAVRDKIWNWYKSTLYTRLMPGGAIILIQTRWSEDDLAGRLIEAQKSSGDMWEIINLPAIAGENDPIGRQPGEALWPEAFPIIELERIRGVLIGEGGPREWSALYQQDPQPESGAYFTKNMIRYYKGAHPTGLQIYGASDYAVTRDGDYTVHGIIGVDHNDDMYVLDWWRMRTTPDIWIDTLIDLAQKWKPVKWAEERGQITQAIGSFLEQRMRERRIYFHREQFAAHRDKRAKARNILGRMSMGKVYLPESSHYTADLVNELLKFDAGKYDDQVDVMSMFGRMLNEMRGGRLTREEVTQSNWTFNYLLRRNRRSRMGLPSIREAPVVQNFQNLQLPFPPEEKV